MMNLNNLHCIDLDQPTLKGFRKFISCWLYQDDKITFVVDPGPLSTINHLYAVLCNMGITQLDYILLTHIHIDHAGGTAELLKHYPTAQVICHPQGIEHLISPNKLWLGSQKVLGNLAEVYGEILPIPKDNISFAANIGHSKINAYLTPGHAQHHCCYMIDDLLFGGEIAGVHCEVDKGIYMRPATPPRFILDVAVNSLEQMLALAPRYMVIAHHGLVSPATDYLKIGLKQLKIWVRGVAEISIVAEEIQEETLFDWLLKHDENYRNIHQLDNDIQQRERYFLSNTHKGMLKYYEELPPTEQETLLQSSTTDN